MSAQANSPEFPVYINGKLCTDMEGHPGLCSKRIRSTEGIRFKFDPQPYSFLLTVACTQGVTPIAPVTNPANNPLVVELRADDFSQFRAFTCVGEVSPQDRSAPVSAKWRISFVVVDEAYLAREQAMLIKQNGADYLVLGQYARSAWVFDDGKWSKHWKETVIPVKRPESVKAMSESYAMRFNAFNMKVTDSGP